MWPIGPLMWEHRLIERMVALIDKEAARGPGGGEPDLELVDHAVRFFRLYADRCHHGKEEDLLFKALESKPLTDDQQRIMAELVEEHKQGRRMVGDLEQAKQDLLRGDQAAQGRLYDLLGQLARFYPRHIEKEDKHFFHPVMEYFDDQAKQDMLAEFQDFDAKLVGEFFTREVEELEAR